MANKNPDNSSFSKMFKSMSIQINEPFVFARQNKILSLLLLLALFLILLINYILISIPQKWDYGYITGRIITNISIGYIVSLIFYYLVVYQKNKRDQLNIAPRISKSINFILHEADTLEKQLHDGKKGGRDPNVIKEICRKKSFYEINFTTHYRNGKKEHHWVEFLINVEKQCRYYMNNIFKLQNVSSDLIRILNDLEDSQMFSQSKLVVGDKGREDRSIELLTKQIIEFFEIIHRLERYWEDHFSDFHHHRRYRNSF